MTTKEKLNQIYVSPIFIAFKLRKAWPFFDFIARYNVLVLFLTITVLTLTWWLNGAMIFMLLSILGLNPSIMINSRNQLPYRNGADIETSNYFRG